MHVCSEKKKKSWAIPKTNSPNIIGNNFRNVKFRHKVTILEIKTFTDEYGIFVKKQKEMKKKPHLNPALSGGETEWK